MFLLKRIPRSILGSSRGSPYENCKLQQILSPITTFLGEEDLTEEIKDADKNGLGYILGIIISGMQLLVGIVGVAIFFCGMRSITSNSRTAYAFSRDGAMPLSSLWRKVNQPEVPINAVWFSVFISFCMALTSLGSIVAFEAMVSIATIGLYIAYALPIFFRVTLAKKRFVVGPFNLGGYGIIVGWIAVILAIQW